MEFLKEEFNMPRGNLIYSMRVNAGNKSPYNDDVIWDYTARAISDGNGIYAIPLEALFQGKDTEFRWIFGLRRVTFENAVFLLLESTSDDVITKSPTDISLKRANIKAIMTMHGFRLFCYSHNLHRLLDGIYNPIPIKII